MPQVVILAGPNGAGKSTLATRLVPRGVPFLNADDIARERAAAPGPSADLAAGRILLQRLSKMEETGAGFALETNLANRSLSVRIPRWQAQGYHVALLFVWLPNAEMAVQRVAQRVQSGGHSIPEPTIRRRYRAGMHLFLHTYQPLVDAWRVYDNSAPQGAGLVAQGRVRERTVWQQVVKGQVMVNNARQRETDSLDAFWDNEAQLDQLARQAVQEALQEHKRRGQSVVVWQDGRIVTLTPDEIPVAQLSE